MISLTLAEIARAVDGELKGEDISVSSVSTDTRTITSGTLFIALIGENFDAHDFIEQAVTKGAAALIVSQKLQIATPHILVEDTRIALGKLGSMVHQLCKTPTAAITGSCGKTTVKEMLTSILSQKGQVLFTQGNFNNDIGVPLTLLRAKPEDDFAVIELGANHIGEIDYTTRLVNPDVALVNNVAAAHLEGFGSIDGVMQAKGEIYNGLKPGAVAVINLDSNGGQYWQGVLADKTVKTVSMNDSKADYFATDIQLNERGEASFIMTTPIGECVIQLSLVGQHNVANALSATSLALEFGASLEDVKSGLNQLTKVSARAEVIELNKQIRLIDDSYNASVPAMKAAIDLLSNYRGKRWLILGNMAELGEESLALHRQVGQHAAPFKFDYVLTYGTDAKVISEESDGIHFCDHQSMIDFIQKQLGHEKAQQQTLLVKGALSAGMSVVVKAIKESFT